MKSSLTLVSSSDSAEQVAEVDLLPEAEAPSDQADKKPHLRLVGPENQADFIKETLATRQKRKPRKRKADGDESKAKKSKAVAKTVSEKKPRKPYTRKPKAVQPEAQAEESEQDTSVLLVPDAFYQDRQKALYDLIEVLSKFAESKADSLVQLVIADLGDEAPNSVEGEFDGQIDPLVTSSFESAVEQALMDSSIIETVDPATSPVAETFTFNFIGELFVSAENDPFGPTEWTLFEENFTSRWYDSKAEAMTGLHDLLVNAGLNFACEVKVISRYFTISDYAFKRYAFTAVVGVYSEHQECGDQARCQAQDGKIKNLIVPEGQIAIDRIQALHRSERKAQMKPEGKLYDNLLKWFSYACAASLVVGVVKVAFETGYF